jgi:hypothetical protein
VVEIYVVRIQREILQKSMPKGWWALSIEVSWVNVLHREWVCEAVEESINISTAHVG